jgi:CRISPR-associated protein Cmr4
MFQTSKPLFFICETPLHAGSGSDLGIVDLPIQREKHTGFPKIESSSLKGAIREAVEGVFIKEDAEKAKERKNPIVTALFGPEDSNDAHMGALGFSDARLLLFPVKSMKGVFAWVTCPKVLDQFKRDMNIVKSTENPSSKFDILGDYSVNTEGGVCKLLNQTGSNLKVGTSILLEEYAFTHHPASLTVDNQSLQEWFAINLPTEWQVKIKEDIVILSNDDFKDFVNLSTEVITRTKINNDTGTVQPGALFTEEFLPAESVLYSLIMASPTFRKEKGDLDTADKVMAKFTEVIAKLPVMQIGGNATLGKGIVRTKIV